MNDESGQATNDRPHYEELAPGALDDIGERRELRIAGIRLYGRRRRPSGEKSPLPRALQKSGWAWLLAGVTIAVIWIMLFAIPGTADWWTRLDNRILSWMVDLRNDTATNVMDTFELLGSVWFYRPVRWIIILMLVIFRRWRILIGVLVAFIVVDAILAILVVSIGRPRPLVDIIGDWTGYSHPSTRVAQLAVTLVVAGYALIPKGVWRTRSFALAVAVVAALGVSLMYLGTDHPSDVFVGALLGPTVGVLVFRLVAPESVFPVSYQRGRAAHLDVSGERGRAISEGPAGAARRRGPFDRAVRNGGVRGFDAASHQAGGRSRHLLFRQAVRQRATCVPTAGTRRLARCSTDPLKTRCGSPRCDVSSSTRTTSC